MKTRVLSLLLLLSGLTTNAQFMSNMNNFTGSVAVTPSGAPIDVGYSVEVYSGTDASGRLLASGTALGFGFFDAGQVDIGTASADVFVRVFNTNPNGFAGAHEWSTIVTTATGGDLRTTPPSVPGRLVFPGTTLDRAPTPYHLSLMVNAEDGRVLGLDGTTPVEAGYSVEIFSGNDASGALLALGTTTHSGLFNAGKVYLGAEDAEVFVRIFDTNPLGYAGATERATLLTTAEGGGMGSLNFPGVTLDPVLVPEPATSAVWALGILVLFFRWGSRDPVEDD